MDYATSTSSWRKKYGLPKTRRKQTKKAKNMPPSHVHDGMDVQSKYRDLLNPIKDPEKSFAINVSQLLLSYIEDVVEGREPVNFNSAALLVQGSASIYGKKVEYLYKLAHQLHETLTRFCNNEQQQPQTSSKKETKGREKKEKVHDPFISTEIKLGKNLSCLKKKNPSKTVSRKTLASAKKSRNTNVSVHLLSHNNDEKGEVFYDTSGEVVGNRGDFAINKCRLTSSGWLLLPTVNPNLVPSFDAVPDYYDNPEIDTGEVDDCETGNGMDCFDNIQGSPDEGFDSCPASSDVQQPTPIIDFNTNSNNTDVSSKDNKSGAPSSTDEGIGDTPMNIDDSPGAENVPIDDGGGVSEKAPAPVRQGVRKALRSCQLAIEDDPLAGININKELLKKKKIEKKNVRRLPEKLKLNGAPPPPLEPIATFCARTFFTTDERTLDNSLLRFDTESFCLCSNFMKRITNKIQALKTSDKKNKNIAPIEDERVMDVEEKEVSRDANEDDETLCIPFDDNDVQIDHEEPIMLPGQPPFELPERETHVPPATADLPSPDISHIAHAECENYIREVHQFVHNSEITERVHEWEKSVKPFLEEMEKRKSFDINYYGSRILNAFGDNNRKQTMTFRNFCRNMEKWEIHRFFMALLPLANIGNVSLEKEIKEDGSEEIFITLLSRKMHHKELEEFGHNDGTHK